MKSLKAFNVKAILIIALLTGLFAADIIASQPARPPRGGRHSRDVGAPLDGGILTILLGGAGAAYFAMRKKKKQGQ